MRSRDPIDLLEARAATCGYLRRCQGLRKKGDRVLYWNSLLKYMETRVMKGPVSFRLLFSFHNVDFSHTWYLRKATMEENLTAPVVRFLKKNSPRTSGFTEGSINQP